MFLGTYIHMEKTNLGKCKNQIKASQLSVLVHGESHHFAKKLQQWTHSFIDDCEEIPENIYGQGNKSAIDDNDLAQKTYLHLQSIEKYIKAEDIVHFCDTPEMLVCPKLTKTILVVTAQWWLAKMGYHQKCNFKGQYINGHE